MMMLCNQTTLFFSLLRSASLISFTLCSRIPQNANPSPSNAGNASAEQQSTAQDAYLPIANIVRIMRQILPTHAKISHDSKETLQLCLSEYIGFVTSEANDICKNDKRRTITAADLLSALEKLGFDHYVGHLALYLDLYRGHSKGSSSQRGESSAMGRSAADGGPAVELPPAPTAPSYGPSIEQPPTPDALNYGSTFPGTGYFDPMGMDGFREAGSSSGGAGPAGVDGFSFPAQNNSAEFDISAYLNNLGKQ